jgi:hypothetical protein
MPDCAIILIGGGMRSGTTLVQRILCAPPATNPLIGECMYLSSLMGQYASLGGSFDATLAAYFESPRAFADHMRERARAFLQIAADRYRPSRALVLKSPELTPHFPTLAEWFPAVRFIVMLRDPRDAIASMLDVGERHRATGQRSVLTEGGRDIARLVRMHRAYYARLSQGWEKLRTRTLVVRYEDLVRDPEAALKVLAGFTGLDLAAGNLAPTQENVSEAYVTDAQKNAYVRGFVTPLYAEPPQDSQIGRHRERLSPDEIRYIEQHCADIAAAGLGARYW